ncbi:sulfurtransferase [Corynebacterium pseudotuberculosis]|uniref:Sulfurtransferase n=2 Tax=Corynebacterium pseudotuberculosis TaxID=1719 RepID=D9QEP5_CORP2|nr:sulfurtransferase [Corynebacterium pseudotuberculosis]ADK28275.1 sulfurtransferase [Corynebacterium pseudotuberculosis FRC41]ADL09968.1 sulfurtransferase [Corynebacterium pseudotuberculosis C231]ADL20372.1 sulfurtransferase [Corynebacterium pseudotuberculosis 1002]ADO25760.1 sulfurtransferase [Corynebacterium pseudotuberculosis I19]AEK91811.1 Thiosulfate sulfurtransferase [Corynebacterium pseudotuberculosis PAT10]
MPAPYDPHPLFQDYAHPEKLVSASWLSARLGTKGLRVVESDEDSLLYDIGHIPGAVRIDWAKDLNNKTIRDYITGEDFAALMSAKGIARDDTVVIYGDKSNWWAAFTLWIFELFGHEDVRILNGGRDAWMAEERDTSYAVPEYPATDYPVIKRADHPDRIYVQELLEKLGTPKLIDVRSPEEYNGTADADSPSSGVLRRGHVPTAVNIPWEKSVHPNSRFRSAEELSALYAEIPKDAETVVYCQVGDRAAHTWFVLKHLLGYDFVRNYDGSWAEWGNMVKMPIATGDEPGQV